MSKKIYICCPGNVVTGGPELLHQFADSLRNEGVDSYMLYFPFDKTFSVPDAYKDYNVNIARYSDVRQDADSLVILPEVGSGFSTKFPLCTICIWWLSIDNFFGGDPNSLIVQSRHYIACALNRRMSFSKIKRCINLAQSEYASMFLKRKNIEPMLITDYLNNEHLSMDVYSEEKEDIIVYNPKKGVEISRKLIEKNKDWRFVPIINMTATEVKSLLLKSKVYIDFGNHPGKDRLPREAAMAGCCIITGTRGSAGNDIDVAIQEKYKLSENHIDFENRFESLVSLIFKNYTKFFLDFKTYREKIVSEPHDFKRQVKCFVEKYCK
ncbi:hypothetical protein F6Q06_18855 [Pectobacterium parmentieri]|uniref:Uncharacterized protein n=1 Tax=Pectobacterium parmentieri TaxID=1905730 RepID=A0ABS0S5B7_PECPM|nr:hypothetical protein [Pectobacterium parmentieri]MBI0556531.1 hypothetical protein [Pectobacterium parmentieri]